MKNTIIDENELHKIKVKIYQQPDKRDQTTSDKIERDIVNPEDIILPRKIGKTLYVIL